MATRYNDTEPQPEDNAGIELEDQAQQNTPPLPELLRELVEHAVREGATDVHIDRIGRDFLVRFRVDGMVHEKYALDHGEGQRLVNQIKIAAEMEIEHTHAPHESQFHWEFNGSRRDIRVTLIPTFDTEVAHLRLLTAPEDWRDVKNLGMSERDLQRVERAMADPQGLVLVSGPTGAGKTTTLYALAGMHELRDRVAASIEDPVEFDLDYVRQLRVDHRHGIDMGEGLAVLLRMDPDILLIGEVRDRESAVTAAHAALAGRLVMATVHARDTASAIESMHYQSVPYYILGGAIRLVICQNLVRRVCPECADSRGVQDYEKQLFERYGIDVPSELKVPVGCEHCNGYGYYGRTGVFEVAVVDEELGAWLAKGHHADAIRKRFAEAGALPLAHDALTKAAAGVSTVEEALRFISPARQPEVVIDPEASRIG